MVIEMQDHPTRAGNNRPRLAILRASIFPGSLFVVWMMLGFVWNTVPMPWPQKSRTEVKPYGRMYSSITSPMPLYLGGRSVPGGLRHFQGRFDDIQGVSRSPYTETNDEKSEAQQSSHRLE